MFLYIRIRLRLTNIKVEKSVRLFLPLLHVEMLWFNHSASFKHFLFHQLHQKLSLDLNVIGGELVGVLLRVCRHTTVNAAFFNPW